MRSLFFCANVRSQWLSDWVILPLWQLYDFWTSKRMDRWAFFVHPLKSDQFIDNSRAVFEAVKRDPNICKVVFVRDVAVDLRIDDDCNTVVVNMQSIRGLLALSRCGVFFLTNAVALDVSWRWEGRRFSVVKPTLKRRIVINLWHSISLKRLFALSNEQLRRHADRVSFRRKERGLYHGLVASSDIDSYAMSAMFHPLKYGQVWITGLPRNDFLKMAHDSLPRFLRDEVDIVRRIKSGRRLILYAPTYRENDFLESENYQFTDEQVARLKALMRQCNAVLGFRMHYFRNGVNSFNLERHLDGVTLVDVGHEVVREIAPVLREADLVLTDYSSVYIDAMYLDKPVVSFAYDLQRYKTQQNGLLYDMELAFPGPVVSDFDALVAVLEKELACSRQASSDRYRLCKKIFFNYLDTGNTQRVIDRLASLGVF